MAQRALRCCGHLCDAVWADRAQCDESPFPQCPQLVLRVSPAVPGVCWGLPACVTPSLPSAMEPGDTQRAGAGLVPILVLLTSLHASDGPALSCFSICFWTCSLGLRLTPSVELSLHRPPLALFAQPLTLCTPGSQPALVGITVIQLNGDNNHLAGCSTCLERAGQCVHVGQVCASFELIKKIKFVDNPACSELTPCLNS